MEKLDDEKILWNGFLDYKGERIYCRAVEYFSLGIGTDMVGVWITRGDGTVQHVDVTKRHYDVKGLDKVVISAIEVREKFIKELEGE